MLGRHGLALHGSEHYWLGQNIELSFVSDCPLPSMKGRHLFPWWAPDRALPSGFRDLTFTPVTQMIILKRWGRGTARLDPV